jgi:hypothetical protein
VAHTLSTNSRAVRRTRKLMFHARARSLLIIVSLRKLSFLYTPCASSNSKPLPGKHSVFSVSLFRALLGLIQSSSKRNRIPGNQANFKISGNGNKRRLKLVILNIIRIWGFSLTGNNLVCSDQPDKSRVQQSGRNGLSRASSGACAK